MLRPGRASLHAGGWVGAVCECAVRDLSILWRETWAVPSADRHLPAPAADESPLTPQPHQLSASSEGLLKKLSLIFLKDTDDPISLLLEPF